VQRKGKESGDLYVHFKILAPTSEDPEVAAAIETLAKHDGEDPRQGIAL
jgi:DnaJ-class molecular chaperone